jgi:hypothetical protein
VKQLIPVLALLVLIAACGKEEQSSQPTGPHPDEGKVLEKIDVPNYTYIRTVRLGKEIWVAAPTTVVEVGDQVIVPEGMPQRNYHSETLNRTFDRLYMVSGVQVVGREQPSMPSGHPGGMPGMPEGHPPVGPSGGSDLKPALTGGAEQHTKPGKVTIDTKTEKAAGGYTVAEVFASKADLKDKMVILRGKVVKFNPEIMGKNWLHVQDGTGEKGTNDITVTSAASAKVGDTVLVKGKLSLDRDFGFGYKYALIIEDAEVTVE